MHKIAENWRGDLNITSLVPTGPTDRRIVSIISEVKEKVMVSCDKGKQHVQYQQNTKCLVSFLLSYMTKNHTQAFWILQVYSMQMKSFIMAGVKKTT